MAENNPQYKTKGPVAVEFSTHDGKLWRLKDLVTATVAGHYLATAAGSEQDRARWDGKLTLIGVKRAEILNEGAEPDYVSFDHGHKEYFGFFADHWQDGPAGVTAHVNHTANDFPPDTVYEPA